MKALVVEQLTKVHVSEKQALGASNWREQNFGGFRAKRHSKTTMVKLLKGMLAPSARMG